MSKEILQNNVREENEASLISRWRLLNDKYNFKNFIFSLLLILLLSFSFVLLGIDKINTNTNPEAYDTTAFLAEANFIKEHGGIKNFLNLCLTGKYKQANQHPLYPLALSPFASRDISFFINAKIASLVIGLILLLLLFIIARQKYGDLCALIAVFGVLLNHVFLKWTTIVACESLLMLFTLLTMHFILQGFRNNKYWAHAGIFAGLAFLTKGTALFLIPGFVFSSLTIYRLRVLKNKYFWSFFILFILVASPLVIRNVVVYKHPFFNINIDKLSYTQAQLYESAYAISTPEQGGIIPVYPQSESLTSLSKHSRDNSFNLHSLLNKGVTGVARETAVFLSLLNILPISDFLSKPFRLIFGLFLFSFFMLGITREKSSGGRAYLLTTLLTFCVCLVFFRPFPRYLLPVIPIVWIYIAIGILTLLDLVRGHFLKSFSNFDILLSARRSLAGACIVLLVYVIATQSISNPVRSVDYSDSRHDLLNWLRANLNKGDRYAEGPNFNWQLDKGTWILPPKSSRLDLVKYNSFAKKHGITYIIIDWYSLTVSRYRGGGIDRRKKIEGYFEFHPNDGIIQKKNVGAWELVYKDPRKKVEFMVFKIL